MVATVRPPARHCCLVLYAQAVSLGNRVRNGWFVPLLTLRGAAGTMDA
mgnify:CR=1 FL=1